MIPIRDDNPKHSTPIITIALIVINSAIFLTQVTMQGDKAEAFIWKYGFVPAKLVHSPAEFEAELPGHAPIVPAVDRNGRVRVDMHGRPLGVRQPIPVEAAVALPAWLSIFTCMFLHGGWMHLIGNMLYLWTFGNSVEDRLGPVLFVVFYVATGLVGNLAHTYFQQSWVPLVGASGAISGVMGAYIILFARVRILALVPAGWYWFTIKLPAWMFLAIYVLVQNLYPAYFGRGDHVAYWAHIGGFAGGAAFIFLFPKRKRPIVARRAGSQHDKDDDADFVL